MRERERFVSSPAIVCCETDCLPSKTGRLPARYEMSSMEVGENWWLTASLVDPSAMAKWHVGCLDVARRGFEKPEGPAGARAQHR
jgi:hypothetical protein